MNFPREATVGSSPQSVQQGRYKGLLLGLLAYIMFEYVRFGVWIPSLAEFHPQKIIAIVTLISFVIFYKDPIHHPVILICLLAIIALSTFMNLGDLSRQRALDFFKTIAKITALYYLITNILIERSNLKKFLIVYLLCNLVLVLTGVATGGSEGDLSGGVFAGGFLSDSNDYALAVNIIFPFFWYFHIYEKQRLRKIIFAIATLLCILAVIYSFSRGGFVGLSATILYILLTSRKKLRNLVLLIFLLSILATLTPRSYIEKMQTITQAAESSKRSSSQIRLNLWKIGLVMTIRNPFFGVGPGNYPYKINEYGREVLGDMDEVWYLAGRITHNAFINVSSELGISGFLVFMALIVIAYKDAAFSQSILDSTKIEKDSLLMPLPSAIRASLIAYCTTSFFLSSSFYPHVYILSALAAVTKYNVSNLSFSKSN